MKQNIVSSLRNLQLNQNLVQDKHLNRRRNGIVIDTQTDVYEKMKERFPQQKTQTSLTETNQVGSQECDTNQE